MATWKKIIVSGSNISQLNNDAGYLTTASDLNAFATASINGVNLLADASAGVINFVTASGEGITAVGTPGTDTVTLGLSAIPNTSLANDSITVGSTEIDLGATSTTLAGLTSVTSTGFTGSLSSTSVLADGVTATTQTTGDNSTKVATTAYVDAVATAADLDLAGDGSTTTAVDLDSQTLTFTGNDGLQLSASAQTITATIADDGIANAKLANDSITIGDTLVALGGTITAFSGSFQGDGSGLTGTGGSIISGDAADNQVAVFNSSNTIDGYANFTFNDGTNTLTVTGDQLITGDLTVQGTASFESRNDLIVADRFILMASGSSTAGDGGIVVQQDSQNIGELFGFDSSTSRWAVTSSFNAGTSAFTPSAFMAAAIEGAGTDPDAVDAQYGKKGNLFVGTDENIWIYS